MALSTPFPEERRRGPGGSASCSGRVLSPWSFVRLVHLTLTRPHHRGLCIVVEAVASSMATDMRS